MAVLRPAGFFESLLSFFSPRRLEVQVRTVVLDNGDVELKPVFLIHGHEVPPDGVSPDKSQKVLGRHVYVGREARRVLDLTKGKPTRLAKSKAASLLESLSTEGVAVRTRDGKSSVQIKTAKPSVQLELRPDDSLQVASQLVTSEGKVLKKPKDIDALRREEGWHVDGEDLVKVDLTNTPLDRVLLQDNGSGTLEGNDVPRFLQTLDSQAQHVGDIERNEALENVSVSPTEATQRLAVTGGEDHISLEPQLVFTTPDNSSYSYTEAELLELEDLPGTFARVEEGWIEIDRSVPQRFREATNELENEYGALDRIEGIDIPKVLSELQSSSVGEAGSQTPWNVYYSKAVADSHRLCDQLSSLEFRLNIIESDGKSLLHLDPIYSHDRFRLNHSEVERASDSGDDWVRRSGAWVHVDEERYKKVADFARTLKLSRAGDGFSFPAADRERVLDVFSTLGTIHQSEAYADFLVKLHDFQRIEEAPLPRNLRSTIQLRPYQQHGFNWLAFLQRFSLNGILADDMGLGKTLQTLTVVERTRELSGSQLPTLIICPTSVMLNWRTEIRKFLETSDVVVYHGNTRQNSLDRIREAISPRNRSSRSLYVVTSYDT